MGAASAAKAPKSAKATNAKNKALKTVLIKSKSFQYIIFIFGIFSRPQTSEPRFLGASTLKRFNRKARNPSNLTKLRKRSGTKRGGNPPPEESSNPHSPRGRGLHVPGSPDTRLLLEEKSPAETGPQDRERRPQTTGPPTNLQETVALLRGNRKKQGNQGKNPRFPLFPAGRGIQT